MLRPVLLILGFLVLVADCPSARAEDDSHNLGTNEKSSDALIGIFYDLKQTQKREPIDVDYLKTLGEFLDSNWDENVLRRFFRGTRPVYATEVFIPNMGAGGAPKAFGLENVVQPSHWFVVYKGQVSPPSDGVYRFVGASDDVLAVAVNGKTELVSLYGGWKNYSKWKEPDPSVDVECGEGKLRHGDWFECKKDQIIDLDIVIGEYPGNAFGAWLLIQKKGDNYPVVDTARVGKLPVYPVFQTRSRTIPQDRQPIPYTTASPPWTGHQ